MANRLNRVVRSDERCFENNFSLIFFSRQIGLTKEQEIRIGKGLISILSHDDPDYRMVAATLLAEMGQETKEVDIALLNSLVNDSRVREILFRLRSNDVFLGSRPNRMRRLLEKVDRRYVRPRPSRLRRRNRNDQSFFSFRR